MSIKCTYRQPWKEYCWGIVSDIQKSHNLCITKRTTISNC
jgi:hypothetical protein